MAFDTVSNCEESKDSWLLESAAMGNTAGALQAPGARSRAWVELDRAALEHNTAFLRSRRALTGGARRTPFSPGALDAHGGVDTFTQNSSCLFREKLLYYDSQVEVIPPP